jgi:hypothetical protein
MSSPRAPASAGPSPRSRRVRRWSIALLATALLLVVALFVVTRPPVLARLLAPALGRAVGGEVTVRDVRIEAFHVVRAAEIGITAPGWSGEAAEVFHADDVRVSVSLPHLLIGSIRITELGFGRIRVRAAERGDGSGRYNLLDLRPDLAGGDEPLRPIPITIDALELETGYVDAAGAWTRTGARLFEGRLGPLPGQAPGGAVFSFALTDAVGEGGVFGTWDERTFAFSAAFGAFDFDGPWRELAPMRVRRILESLEFRGRVRGADLSWSPDRPFAAEFELENVRLVLPAVDLDERWARVRGDAIEPARGSPTIEVYSGRLRTEGSRITLADVHGSMSAADEREGSLRVPGRIGLDLDLGAATEATVDWSDEEARGRWVRDALRLAPFELTFAIDAFDASPHSGEGAGDGAPTLLVPRPVASALATFGLTSWRIDVAAKLSRDAPTRGEDGSPIAAPIRSTGRAVLSNGSGSYRHFPYPLREVRGHLSFQHDDASSERFTVDHLTGVGPDGGTATIRGVVERPGPSPRIDLVVTATGFPIDQRLFDAFPPRQRAAFARVFHRPSFDALVASGLLPQSDGEVADLDRLRRLRARLEGELAATTDETERSRIEAELARAQRMASARPFAFGGTVDFECRILRPFGEGPLLRVEGDVDLARVGVVLADFPYPLLVTKGRFHFAPEGVRIAEPGLEALTLEGGLIRLNGTIGLNRRPGEKEARLAPDLTLVGVGDRISERLLAAIPPPESLRDGWPGEALAPLALALRRAGLSADFDLQGRLAKVDGLPDGGPDGGPDGELDGGLVGGDADRDDLDLDVWMTLALSNGSIAVGPPLDGDGGWSNALPEGLALSGLEGLVRLEPTFIDLDVRATGPEGAGVVGVKGRLATEDRARDLSIELDAVAAGAWLEPLIALPPDDDDPRSRLWRRLAPQGTFDSRIRLRSDADGPDRISAEIAPRALRLGAVEGPVDARPTVDGGRLTLELDDGAGVLRFDGLSASVDGGRVVVDGDAAIDSGRVGRLALDVRGMAVPFESRFVERIVDAVGGAALANPYRAAAPSGRFDGFFRTERADAAAPLAWNASLRPLTLALSIGGARPEATFVDDGVLRIDARGLAVEGIVADIDGGRMRLDGVVDLESSPRSARFDYGLEAHSWTPAVATMLPPPLSDAHSAIGFTAAPLALRNASVELSWDPALGIADPLLYALKGSLSFRDGSFSTGLDFRDVDGSATFDFILRRRSEGVRDLAFLAGVEAETASLYRRRLTDLRADVTLEQGGTVVGVRDIAGTVGGGRLVGDASFDLPSRRYAADIAIEEARLEAITNPLVDSERDRSSLDATVEIEGVAGDEAARTGSGRISIRNARMADAPITMRLLQLTQLSLPLTSSLSSADIDFLIRGPFAHFTSFRMASDGLELQATGHVDLRDFSIAANFRSRGRLWLVSDLLGAIGDQFFDIEVTGPLDAPNARLRALPGLSRPASAATDE